MSTLTPFYDGPKTRVPNWETHWLEFIDQYSSQPHVWGSFDCVFFAMNNVGALVGEDLTSSHLDKYTTQLGAFKYLKTIGYASVGELADSFLEDVPLGSVQRGDLVLFDNCLGVVYNAYAFFMGEEGFEKVHVLACDRAWKVGNDG